MLFLKKCKTQYWFFLILFKPYIKVNFAVKNPAFKTISKPNVWNLCLLWCEFRHTTNSLPFCFSLNIIEITNSIFKESKCLEVNFLSYFWIFTQTQNENKTVYPPLFLLQMGKGVSTLFLATLHHYNKLIKGADTPLKP